MSKVGVIGLGNMGGGIAKNLCENGLETYGFDISESQIKRFEGNGGKGVSSIKELSEICDSVFVMVMNKQQVHAVVDEIIEYMDRGKTIIITATIEPIEIKKAGEKIEAKGINIIDSPVSGGLGGAENGTLALMLSAKKQVLEDNRPFLEAISGSIHHVGENAGEGQTVKASLQLLIGVTFAGIFEAVTLGSKAGLSGQVMFDVFTNSGVRSPLLENCMKLINDRKFENSGSHIDTMHKDLGITTLLAREFQVPAFTANAAYQLFESARVKYPQGDNWIIVKLLEDITNTEVKW